MNRQLRRKNQKLKSKASEFHKILLNAIDLHSKKQFEEAETLYNRLNILQPGNYDVLRHLGILNQDQGNYEKAYNFFLKSIEIKPDGYEAISNLGTIHLFNKNRDLAQKCFEKALSINSNYIPAINNLSGLYHTLNDAKLSLKYAQLALSLQPKNSFTKSQYAKALVLNNKLSDAIKIFRSLSDEHPNDSDFKINLSTALRENGEIEEANKIIKIGFELDFKKSDFFGYYVADKNNNLTPEHIKYYENLLSNGETRSHTKVIIAYAFFEYYRNQKNFELSGKYLTIYNDLQYNLREFDINKEVHFFKRIKQATSTSKFQPKIKEDPIKPIFICGMPRSGTTLCEQILSSHSKISGAGELSELTELSGIENLIQTDNEKISNFEINLKDNLFMQNIRDKYINFLTKLKDNGSNYVTDKLPHNFIFIGLIKIIFPDAKIIYCKRDPIDNCFSLFTHKFIEMSHQYSYNQSMLAKYYLLHEDLMNFWLNKFKDIFVLDNEELVNNQEYVSKELINYCNLDWEEACLNFQDNKRQVRTASIEQVRQPINKKSIGAWKKYETHLSELISTLENLNEQ
tara:strand:+ start:1532 stop:3247 length:1716 start_codon:yes stop_codon:yes gene_type:complete